MAVKYDAVLFDFDGTVADTGKGIFNAVRYAVASLGFAPLSDESLRTFIGPPIYDSFERELGMTAEQCTEAVKKYREIYSEKCIYELELYPGIDSLIRKLKENGIKIAIASSKPAKFIKRLIAFLEYEDLIDFISAPSFDEDHMSKRELINNAVNALGVDKSRTVMVGDRHFDIIGANEAEVDSIGAASSSVQSGSAQCSTINFFTSLGAEATHFESFSHISSWSIPNSFKVLNLYSVNSVGAIPDPCNTSI